MTPPVHVSPAGVLLALAFGGSLAWVMVWMFRGPRPARAEGAGPRRPLDTARLILVPVTGSGHSQPGVELASQLAEEQRAAVLLVYVIEVPLTLSLDVELEQADQQARAALAAAYEVVVRHHVPVHTVIRRDRGLGSGTVAVAKDYQADLIVIGLDSGPEQRRWGWSKTAHKLLREAPCEVIVNRVRDNRGDSPIAGEREGR